MNTNEKYVAECVEIVRETLRTLMENASADARWEMLEAVRVHVTEMLSELAED